MADFYRLLGVERSAKLILNLLTTVVWRVNTTLT